jgi:hypothetical protein
VKRGVPRGGVLVWPKMDGDAAYLFTTNAS